MIQAIPAFATKIRVDFAGTITQGEGDSPFGVLIPADATISGSFYFDMASTGVEVTAPLSVAGPGLLVPVTRTVYRQSIVGGLSFTIPGALTGTSDGAMVAVGNDVRTSPRTTTLFDTLTLQHIATASAQFPDETIPTSPLLINGQPQTNPTFRISLAAPDANLYSTAALPLDPALSDFTVGASSRVISLQDPTIGAGQLRFALTSLTAVAVPEPASNVAMATGIFFIFVRKRRKSCLRE